MTVSIEPIAGIPEVRSGDDLGGLLIEAIRSNDLNPEDGDIVVVTQKIVSKAEGRVVPELPDGKDAWVERETVRVVARRGALVIAETRHGFVCANAGVDASNVGDGLLTLLPDDPDGSAGRMRDALRDAFGVRLAVVITDTFGRPWRDGVVNVAIGCAGLPALVDLRGTLDGSGRILEATVVAFADEIAAASGLAMGKADHLPAVLIRGTAWTAPPAPARAIVRVPSDDLFRESPLQAVSMTGAAPGSGANGAHAGRDGLADALSTAVEAATASLGEDAPAVRFVPLGPSEGGPRVRVGVAVEETGTVPAEVAAGAAAQAFRIALRAQGVSSVLAAASPRPASGPPGLLESPVRVSVVVEAWRP